MTTIVNNPAPATSATTESGGSSLLIGTIVLIGFVMVFLFFGIPAMRRMGAAQIAVPAPQVVLPSKLNVNVTQSK